MPFEDGWKTEENRAMQTARSLDIASPPADLPDALAKAGHSRAMIGAYTPEYLAVIVRRVLTEQGVTIPERAHSTFKEGAFLNPVEKLKAAYAAERPVERDGKELEIERLETLLRVRGKLSSAENSTLHAMKFAKPSEANAPVPASVLAGAQSASERLTRQQGYQLQLKLNREMLQLKSNHARLLGEQEFLLASHVKGLIEVCQRKIENL